MKVMTLNLGGGAARQRSPLVPMYRSARPVIDALAALAVREEIDVLLLQEVPLKHRWHNKQDGTALLRQALAGRLSHSRYVQYPKPRKRLALMVMSRFPIRGYKVTRSKLSRAQTFVAKVGRRRFRLFNYHGDVKKPSDALTGLRQFIGQNYRRGACVLGGDFNLMAGSPALAGLKPKFKDACEEVGGGDCHKTVNLEVHRPRLGPDYIWVAGCTPSSVRSLPEFAFSDHLPVVAELQQG